MKLEFRINGIPKAQPRVKARSRGKFATVYTPKTADSWKSLIMWTAREEIAKCGGHWIPLEGPLKVYVSFLLPRPKSHYKANGELKIIVPRYVDTKPDLDNLIKALLDALVDVQMIKDDRTVATIWVEKIYSVDPGCLVGIEELLE